MPDAIRLSDSEVRIRSAALPDWQLRDGALHRQLTFRDFTDAFSFMTSVAFIAERMNHHPEWRNVYDTVAITLSTHDVGGVSENDFTMASEISEVYRRFAG